LITTTREQVEERGHRSSGRGHFGILHESRRRYSTRGHSGTRKYGCRSSRRGRFDTLHELKDDVRRDLK
ncbi:hypothetical protein Taro_048311, partial [Colocasia esculenta]|nr:hypothetical protein [Colocasia esculenta]